MVLSYVDEASPGIQRYRLDLRLLYPDDLARSKFGQRWVKFAASTPDHDELFVYDGDSLIYPTESFLPRTADGRTPVLLLLGNPASQSVHSGMCFAFERGSQHEHRFWRALRTTGWLSFGEEILDVGHAQRNERRRSQLLEGSFESPFLIGIDVFFTFPSPASAPRWSGVAGLSALFGRQALRQIVAAERIRLSHTVARYMPNGGAVVAFQRDAYENLRPESAQPYSSVGAGSGALSSTISPRVQLFGAPPTRYAHSHAFHSVLRQYAERINAPYTPLEQ